MDDQAAERMCRSKKRFESMIHAAGAIGRMKGKYADAKARPLRWYHCPLCHGYHITTKEPNAEYQRRKALAEQEFQKKSP
jgi:hypothetical protein